MEYICVKFHLSGKTGVSDIIVALLSDTDFEMFEENENELKAFIPLVKFNEQQILSLLSETDILIDIAYTTELIKHQNWNAVWESNYEPILVNDKVYIRAPFHSANKNIEYELLIQPKMSFGTGHHDTTKLMIEYLLSLSLKDKQVLDMGTGTGVLAILAEKMGASSTLAIDNDKNCIINSVENCLNNNCNNVAVLEGDIDNLGNVKFDVVLANINKNVILSYLEKLVTSLKPDSNLVLSGFYKADLKDIENEGKKHQLKLINYKVSDNWCAALFSNS